ncbi:MAG: hypothetical protein AAF623_13065 [Planctomycetota bacterium]
MEYPLNVTFKLFTLAPQIIVTDANQETVCFVKQKMFRLKEAINVFSDKKRQNPLCEIKADRIIDFSAKYTFTDNSGESFGAVRRKGMRSIWKAHYELMDENDQIFGVINEENPWSKVADSFFGEIPVLGAFSGYVFHPKYVLKNQSDQVIIRLSKLPAFFEGKYKIEKHLDMDPVDELRSLIGFLMMILLESRRG